MLDQALSPRYDVASLAAIGRREVQEDAIEAHFPAGAGAGFVVLADGMGGHSAGDVASRIVVSAVSEEMRDLIGHPERLERNIGPALRGAADEANRQVRRQVQQCPDLRGMGATLVATVILGNRLYWISVGDSPLFLLRGDRLRRLNVDHSMARLLDAQVRSGAISRDQADRDPDRHCLTSVLFGHPVPEIDCRERPLELGQGDILLAASDGILALGEAGIAATLWRFRDQPSAEIGARLMQQISEKDDPEQDNVTLCVVRIARPEAVARRAEIVAARALTLRIGAAPAPMTPAPAGASAAAVRVFCRNEG